MSFREKLAWVTLLSVLLSFGSYIVWVLADFAHGDARTNGLVFLASVGAFVILQTGLSLAALWTTPRDGRSPRDERERLIQGRSHTIGFYVLVVLVLLLGVPLHLGHAAAHQLMFFALMGVVITVLVVSAAQIVMFRRGF